MGMYVAFRAKMKSGDFSSTDIGQISSCELMFKKFLESSGADLSLEIQKQGDGFYCLVGEGDQTADTGVAVRAFELLGPDRFSLTTGTGEIITGNYQITGDRYFLHVAGRTYRFNSARKAGAGSTGGGSHRTPMPGKVLAVNVAVGDTVAQDQTLLVVEAMKMENAIKAAFAGTVASVNCAPGDIVNPEDILVELKPIG